MKDDERDLESLVGEEERKETLLTRIRHWRGPLKSYLAAARIYGRFLDGYRHFFGESSALTHYDK